MIFTYLSQVPLQSLKADESTGYLFYWKRISEN